MILAPEYDLDDGVEYPTKSKYSWAYNKIPLSRSQWMYLLIGQCLVSGVVNFFVNLFLTWLMYPRDLGATISFSGQITCIFSDIIVTSFVLPTITAIIASFLVTFDLRRGQFIQPIDERWLKHPFLSWVPTGINIKIILKRAVIFGVFGVCIFAPPTLICLFIATKGNGYMLLKWPFYIFKATWCSLLAMVVAPLIAFILVASYDPNDKFF
ncbi:hypothetical protein SAMD00019534_067430, partial [Acytostelium subglobosum LB1]|uniref:hypothetical protein n=1 Tax=Acytostelium subglobosum LB1 TaxID=1410327 RepID=UPI000644EDF0